MANSKKSLSRWQLSILFVCPVFTKISLKKDQGQLPLHLAKLGHKVSILTRSNEEIANIHHVDSKVKIIKLKVPPIKNDSKLVRKPTQLSRGLYDLFLTFIIFYYLFKYRRKIDCVATYFRNGLLSAIFFRIIKKEGINVVKMDSNPILWYTSGNSVRRTILKCLANFLFRLLSVTVDLVIVEGPQVRKRLARLHSSISRRMFLLPNGINQEEFDRFIHQVNRTVSSKHHDYKYILFVGSIIYRKGIDILINAFMEISNEFPEWRVKFIGKIANWKYKEILDKLILSHGLQNRILFVGEVSEEELVRVFINSEIFCFPSRHEAFSIALLEAMYFGKAIVASRAGAAEWCLDYGNAGLILKENDINELASSLRKLMRDSELRTTLGKNAKQRCIQLFNWKKICRRLDARLCELTSAQDY